MKRKKQKISNLNLNLNKFCLVNIIKTKNNLHINISSLFGKITTFWTMSAGQIKTIKTRKAIKKTNYSHKFLYQLTNKKLIALGFNYFVLNLIGTFKSSKFILYQLIKKTGKIQTKKSNRKIIKIKLINLKIKSSISHNGCRSPKIRRV